MHESEKRLSRESKASVPFYILISFVCDHSPIETFDLKISLCQMLVGHTVHRPGRPNKTFGGNCAVLDETTGGSLGCNRKRSEIWP